MKQLVQRWAVIMIGPRPTDVPEVNLYYSERYANGIVKDAKALGSGFTVLKGPEPVEWEVELPRRDA